MQAFVHEQQPGRTEVDSRTSLEDAVGFRALRA